jgi:Phage conserved hypothetical protein BR0599
VTAVADQRTFTVSGLDTFAEDWFSRGLMTWTSGANAGRKAEAKLHSKRDGSVTLELWQAMAEEVGVGDAFTVPACCDKHFKTCKGKFDNSVNFRGFPHVPGVDFALSRRPFHSGMRPESEEARMQTRVLNELRRMNRKLDLIINRLDKIEKEGVTEMAWIEDMRAELANNTSVSQGAVVAVNTLADKVQELINNGADPVELQAFVDTLRANDTAVSDAIKAAPPRSASRRRCRSSPRSTGGLSALNRPTDRSAAFSGGVSILYPMRYRPSAYLSAILVRYPPPAKRYRAEHRLSAAACLSASAACWRVSC